VELVLTLGTGRRGAVHQRPLVVLASRSATTSGARRHDVRGLPGPPGPGQVRRIRWNELFARPSNHRSLVQLGPSLPGGGNTKKIDFVPPKNVEIVSNESGLLAASIVEGSGVGVGRVEMEIRPVEPENLRMQH